MTRADYLFAWALMAPYCAFLVRLCRVEEAPVPWDLACLVLVCSHCAAVRYLWDRFSPPQEQP